MEKKQNMVKQSLNNCSTRLKIILVIYIITIQSVLEAAHTRLAPYVKQKEPCILNQKGYSSHRLQPP